MSLLLIKWVVFLFKVSARDLGTPSNEANTQARMFTINDENRMVLALKKDSITEQEIEQYRLLLQKQIGKEVLIEKVTARTYMDKNETYVLYDKSAIDIVFTCVEKDLDTLCTHKNNIK